MILSSQLLITSYHFSRWSSRTPPNSKAKLKPLVIAPKKVLLRLSSSSKSASPGSFRCPVLEVYVISWHKKILKSPPSRALEPAFPVFFWLLWLIRWWHSCLFTDILEIFWICDSWSWGLCASPTCFVSKYRCLKMFEIPAAGWQAICRVSNICGVRFLWFMIPLLSWCSCYPARISCENVRVTKLNPSALWDTHITEAHGSKPLIRENVRGIERVVSKLCVHCRPMPSISRVHSSSVQDIRGRRTQPACTLWKIPVSPGSLQTNMPT